MSAPVLPPQFADLEPFVADWGRATEDARSQQRWLATPADLRAFCTAVAPHVGAILALLDAHPFGAVPAELRPLYRLALAYAEAAPHLELAADTA